MLFSYFLIFIVDFAAFPTQYLYPDLITTLCVPTFKDLVFNLASPLLLVFMVNVLDFLPV